MKLSLHIYIYVEAKGKIQIHENGKYSPVQLKSLHEIASRFANQIR